MIRNNKIRRSGLAIFSGMLAFMLFELSRSAIKWTYPLDKITFLAPGILLSVFVLIPLIDASQRTMLRIVMTVMLSTVIWYGAYLIFLYLTVLTKGPAYLLAIVSGIAGAMLLLVVSRYLIPIQNKFTGSALRRALFCGGLSGLLIGASAGDIDLNWWHYLFSAAGFTVFHGGISSALAGLVETGENATMST